MTTLSPVLAGPVLRKTDRQQLSLWMATSVAPEKLQVMLMMNGDTTFDDIPQHQVVQISAKLWIVQFHNHLAISDSNKFCYDIVWRDNHSSVLSEDIRYSGLNHVEVQLSDKADYILHGSCRNPHDKPEDSLIQADVLFEKTRMASGAHTLPDIMLLSGDQIYADHVAGPMLVAIHQVIKLLELPHEKFVGIDINSSKQLYRSSTPIYTRDSLLPHYQDQTSWLKRVTGKLETPIFSSRECENHLITFSEFLAMYLLVWSPELWTAIGFDQIEPCSSSQDNKLLPRHKELWKTEKQRLVHFATGLTRVRRVMAHIPTYMIFDDHDVTDDWNLTVGWEQAAYNNPFSKRIIGNALLGYLICQGWGNNPLQMSKDWQQDLTRLFSNAQRQNELDLAIHDQLVNQLIRYEKWHYCIDSKPKVVVLDTRTRRWRSESKFNKPSGLMDWEAMVEFQQELLNLDSVIVVSPAPMFGVKFIETLQSIATKLGNPLIIDAENWMAHPGSANTLLSIFTHTKTPKNFVILSGDVHYSFMYDIKLRYKQTDSHIYQITCSGIKNEFPEPLLTICDTLDKWLYTPRSPLNWFTKRKRLKIYKRKPEPAHHNRLVNKSGLGLVKLDTEGKPLEVSVLHGDGSKTRFPETKVES
ncbi:alkaline phosphatase D family protein [Vibrio hangzhouensis]|uniref:PhoD-like phosphatase n=1 Tax=Vibrio hangzhouensis TaxID=462991 RepID=A0A1H5WBI2_9VIBR|nr:alkaline phosphatase D family protein [Vibrio hangzhouensis]SEF96740.1 PhoD-like phosphatase [Vibrio hangzhouensis]